MHPTYPDLFIGCDSRWIAAQQKLPEARTGETLSDEDLLGCSPSFCDPEKHVFGCQHYKRNCKLRAACCGKLFTCRFCHDKVSDHSMDRYHSAVCCALFCLKFHTFNVISICLQKGYIWNDVHALLENSGYWTNLYNAFLQWSLDGTILLQCLQVFWWWKVTQHWLVSLFSPTYYLENRMFTTIIFC